MTYGCLDCSRTFASNAAVQSHSRAKGHRIGIECRRCDRIFVNINALNNHLKDAPIHKGRDRRAQKRTASGRNWCSACSRNFSSPQALAQHNASPIHYGRMFKCLFCASLFKSPSAMAMHIESGCHGVNRHQVTSAIHKLKIIPQISVARRIEGPIRPPTRFITYSANERAFNGRAYECYICHATFASLNRLNQHLNSPTHDKTEFQCPKCKSEFQLISGLTQHIESGVCGIARFKEIASHFKRLAYRFPKMLTL